MNKGTPKHNKLEIANTVNVLANNIPAPCPDTHGRGGRDDDENGDNKLRPDLPTYSQDNQTRCALSPPLSQPEYGGTLPAPLSSHTLPASVARTSSLASSNAAEDPEALPSVERTASCSPNSPNKIKASSRR